MHYIKISTDRIPCTNVLGFTKNRNLKTPDTIIDNLKNKRRSVMPTDNNYLLVKGGTATAVITNFPFCKTFVIYRHTLIHHHILNINIKNTC